MVQSVIRTWISCSYVADALAPILRHAINKHHVDSTTVYPKKYAHGFVVLCFVVVMQSFIMNSYEVFIHIHQGCFAGTGAIVRLPQCQWSNSNSNSNIVYLTRTSIQHVWQRTRDWRSYTSTVGRLKLRYRSTAITKATQQGMRSHTIWSNDVAGCGITCWKFAFCR